jgi:ATP-binding protein involved in chromosome partitioning
MTAPTEADIVKVLEKIRDPISGRNVVEAGLIEGVTLRGRHASFTVEVPAARGPSAEPLRKACEDAVAQIPGILSVTAVLTAHHERNPRTGPAPAREHAHPVKAASANRRSRLISRSVSPRWG